MSRESHFDFVIVGQGIAGTTLAWQLKKRGKRVLVVDREEEVTSSKVAAGLMTPVTGKRLVPVANLEAAWTSAQEHYRQVEADTDSQFFHERNHVRFFDSQRSRDAFGRRDFRDHFVTISQTVPLVNPSWFDAPIGGCEMSPAGRLDVNAYLNASRSYFAGEGCYCQADLNCRRDLRLVDGVVEVPLMNAHAGGLIFCQGFSGRSNPWFRNVAFEAARGEILTLHIPGLAETRIVNRGVWLVPCGNGVFMAGSNYDTANLECGPTQQGREEICRRLREFLRLPFEVTGHASGVRPIVSDRHPVIGLHPEHPQLGIFNGLGSKGSLLAPLIAEQFADALTGCGNVVAELDVEVRFPTVANSENSSNQGSMQKSPRLTEQAQQVVRKVVKQGDTVIDATIGNGHDTLFLAKAVGENGRVFGFDIQAEAIQRTSERLQQGGLANSVLYRSSHSRMASTISAKYHGNIAAVMFNLGYLPGGDQSVITTATESCSAISSAVELLRSGGVLTIIAYPGHAGGDDETARVEQLVATLPTHQFETDVRKSAESRPWMPRLFIIRRK